MKDNYFRPSSFLLRDNFKNKILFISCPFFIFKKKIKSNKTDFSTTNSQTGDDIYPLF